jgi:hypothetical protein
MSIALDRRCFTVSLAMPAAQALPVWIRLVLLHADVPFLGVQCGVGHSRERCGIQRRVRPQWQRPRRSAYWS